MRIPVLKLLLLCLFCFCLTVLDPHLHVCSLSFFVSFHSFFLSFCFNQLSLSCRLHLFLQLQGVSLSLFHFKLFFFLSFHLPRSFFSFFFQCFLASFILDLQWMSFFLFSEQSFFQLLLLVALMLHFRPFFWRIHFFEVCNQHTSWPQCDVSWFLSSIKVHHRSNQNQNGWVHQRLFNFSSPV